MRQTHERTWGPPWAGTRVGWAPVGPPPAARFVAAVVVAVGQVAGSFGAAHGQPHRRPVDAAAVVLLLVAPVAITVLGRWVRPAVVAVGAATLAYLAAGYPYGPVFLGLAVALVSAVVRGHRVTAWLVAAAVVAGDGLGRVVFDTDTWSWQSQGGFVAWMLVVLAVAEVIRSGRERAASARAAARETRRRQAGEERLRIAQELHDVVAHHMSLINVQAAVALHLADRRPENVEPALRAIKDASKEALTELRSLIDVLRDDDNPAPRAPAPTLGAVDDIVDRSAHADLTVTKAVDGQQRPLPAAVELAAYRIIQEAITNVVRHAHADRAAVTIGYGADVLSLRIEDDGRGGPRATTIEHGNGLRGMQERAAALGGSFAITASPMGGLRIDARIPTGEPT
jgi:signal transduction histidine kinase